MRSPNIFRPRLEINPTFVLIIAGSVLVHLAILVTAYLCPKTPGSVSQGCYDSASSQASTSDHSKSVGPGSGAGIASSTVGSGSDGSLAVDVGLNNQVWVHSLGRRCCGEGCCNDYETDI